MNFDLPQVSQHLRLYKIILYYNKNQKHILNRKMPIINCETAVAIHTQRTPRLNFITKIKSSNIFNFNYFKKKNNSYYFINKTLEI